MIEGYLLDIHPDYSKNVMVSWIKTNNHCERIVDTFYPKFYVYSSADKLRELEKELINVSYVGNLEFEYRRISLWSHRPKKVLGITIKNYSKLRELAAYIDELGHYRDYQLYNADVRLTQQYMIEKNIFPMAHIKYSNKFELMDAQDSIDYEIPNLKSAEIEIQIDVTRKIPRFDDKLIQIKVNDMALNGDDEISLLLSLKETIQSMNVDIIYTHYGDAFIFPYLYYRGEINGIADEFQLGRDGDNQSLNRKKGRSYFSYGRVFYKPSPHILAGRIHIDRANSFLYGESGLFGLIDLSRISRIPLQMISRLTPGTIISTIQVNQALADGILIHWKKNMPERFKTVEELLISDRGSFIYDPKVGIYENVIEIDFASLYPNIMTKFNISPETILCSCCKHSSNRVPGIGYNICEKQLGLVPKVLVPIIKRRKAYKKLREACLKRYEEYDQKQKAIKWILLTCFGYTGYRNAKFGRIECHESITAFGRKILLDAAEIAEALGYDVLHGIVDSLWLKADGHRNHTELCSKITNAIGITVELEGVYKWIIFLPSRSNGVGALNRYYGLLDDGTLKVRGIELRRSDTPNVLKNAQKDMLDILSKANNIQEFIEQIPDAIEVLRNYARKVLNGECDLKDLIFTIRISQKVDCYHQFNNQVASLLQLEKEGIELQPGEAVRYIITDSKSKNYARRVKVAELTEGNEEYDKQKYFEYLLGVGESLLLPFGYTMKKLAGILQPTKQLPLSIFQ